ncbi:hypothetical protein E4U27_003961, partial [Claviceps purpurea]
TASHSEFAISSQLKRKKSIRIGEDTALELRKTIIPSRDLLIHLLLRGKGRPKGSVAVDKSTDVSRTARRDLSLFEHVQAAEEAEARLHRETLNASKVPSSTAPAAIDTTRLSTTAIGLQRLEAGDSYEPGTVAR